MHKGKLSWFCPNKLHGTGETHTSDVWLRMLRLGLSSSSADGRGWCQEGLGSWGFACPLPVLNPAEPRDLPSIPPALLLPVRLMNAKQTAEKRSPCIDIPKPAAWQMLLNNVYHSQVRFLAVLRKTPSILQMQTRRSQGDVFREGLIGC